MARIDYHEVWDKEGNLLQREEVVVPDGEVERDEVPIRLQNLPDALLRTPPWGPIILDILRYLELK